MSTHLDFYGLTEDRLREVFNHVERHIEDRYGIPVKITDVIDPFTGDLDGAEIHLDYDQGIEAALFTLIHLFGHTVQWVTSERARAIADEAQFNPSVAILDELERYEREACEISLTLLHDADIHDMDQWLADFAACDFAYLRHFYQTGEKAAFRSFWKHGAALLTPIEIPVFEPRVVSERLSGVVV